MVEVRTRRGPIEGLIARPWRLVIVAAALVALPLVMLNELAISGTTSRYERGREDSIQRAASAAAQRLDSRLTVLRGQVDEAVQLPQLAEALHSGSPQRVDEILRFTLARVLRPPEAAPGRLFAVDARGVPVTGFATAAVGVTGFGVLGTSSLGDLDYFKAARAASERPGAGRVTIVGPIAVGALSLGEPPVHRIVLSAPVRFGLDPFVGALILELEPHKLDPLLTGDGGPTQEIHLFDGAGRLIRSTTQAGVGAPDPGLESLGSQLASASRSELRTSAALSRATAVATAPVPVAGWTIVAAQLPTATDVEVADVIGRQRLAGSALALVLVIGAAVLARTGARSLRRRDALAEALEQQTATSEVLQSISRSAFDLQAVLDTVLENAARLCAAPTGLIFRFDGSMFTHGSSYGYSPELLSEIQASGGWRTEFAPDRTTIAGRVALERDVVQIEDVLADPELGDILLRQQKTVGFRTMLGVPIVRDDRVIGVLSLRRNEVRLFTEREVQLVRTFADQAAIAIENVRLFNETREALEQQRAIADVLATIAGATSEPQSVFDVIVRHALRLCEADLSWLWRFDGETAELRAAFGGPQIHDMGARRPIASLIPTRRLLAGQDVSHVPDTTEDPEIEHPERQDWSVFRTGLAVAIRTGSTLFGAIVLWRTKPRPFSEREIELVRTFARQAAIAIENVRLFNETKESLERQTAISEVLEVINTSAFDLQPVFDTVVDRAARLCDADAAWMNLLGRDGSTSTFAAVAVRSPELEEFRAAYPVGRVVQTSNPAHTVMGRAMRGELIHVEDITGHPEYGASVAFVQAAGGRTVLAVPMKRQDQTVGAVVLTRRDVRSFAEREVQLARTFADQAVIAIENVRLFNETKEALEQQTATSEVLKVISQSTFDVQPVLDAVVQTAGRLARADAAWLRRREAGQLIWGQHGSAAHWGATAEMADLLATLFRGESPSRPGGFPGGSILGMVSRERRTINVADIAAEHDLRSSRTAFAVGARSTLAVPVLGQGEPVAYLVLARTRVDPFGDREVQLVETFADQAAIAIENARLFNEIQDKSQLLEVASRHKSEFLANMSHELRTPLNAIIGFTDVMLAEMFGALNEKQKEYLEDVRSSGTHLLTLINDILDLSKIEAGRVELEVTEFSFPDALENAVTLVRERAARHGITLAVDITQEVGTVVADERKLKQILVNLLSNAVKFTPDGGRVGVTARRADHEIEVAVRDTGIGIAPDDRERIFEEFQQVGRDPERAREGTGLGLTLAKRFVELHGGRIWVESEVGQGSTFTFAIPVRQTAQATATA